MVGHPRNPGGRTILVENAQEFIALHEVWAVLGAVGVHENNGVIVQRGCQGEAEEFVVPARSGRHVGLQMQVGGCLQLNLASPLEGSPLGVPVHTSFGFHNSSGATQFFLGPGNWDDGPFETFQCLGRVVPGEKNSSFRPPSPSAPAHINKGQLERIIHSKLLVGVQHPTEVL